MAIKVLGQSYPAANTLTDVYTPSGVTATVSSVVVCNQGRDKATFRIAVAVAGAADTPKQYLYYDVKVLPGDTFTATIGVTLASTDVIRAYSSNGQMSFNVFGLEA